MTSPPLISEALRLAAEGYGYEDLMVKLDISRAWARTFVFGYRTSCLAGSTPRQASDLAATICPVRQVAPVCGDGS